MAFPTNPYGVSLNGFSKKTGVNSLLSPSLVSSCVSLGATSMRYQLSWSGIETTNTNPPTYDWTIVDDLMTQCYNAKLNVEFIIQGPPTWHGTYSCAQDPTKLYPVVADQKVFVTNLLKRYNGGYLPTNSSTGTSPINPKTGQVFQAFYALEVANEGFDDGNLACDTGAEVVPLMQACYPLIAQYSPTTLFGGPAQLNYDKTHFQNWIAGFKAAGGQNYCDYLNLHTYYQFADCPSSATKNPVFLPSDHAPYNYTYSTACGGGTLNSMTLQQRITTIQTALPSKPLWITEWGWNLATTKDNPVQNTQFTESGGATITGWTPAVPDATLTQWISESTTSFLETARTSNYVQRVIVYDIQGLSNLGGTPPVTSNTFLNFQKYVTTKHPQWTTSGAVDSLGLSTSSLSFSATAGGSLPTNQSVTLTNTGGTTNSWSSSITKNSAWLTQTPTSGVNFAPGNTATISVGIQGTLVAGTYTDTIVFTLGKSSVSLSVTLSVAPAASSLSVSQSSLSFTGTAGSSNPPTQTETLTNGGSTSGTWTSSITLTNGSGWLAISPTSGTLAAGATSPAITVTATNVATNLAAGVYTAVITYTLGSASATTNVTLTVNPQSTQNPLTVYLTAELSSVLATANKVYLASGTPTTTHTYTVVGTATGYGQLQAQGDVVTPWGTTPGGGGTSIGTPDGNGWFLDSAQLGNQTILAGAWSGAVRLQCSQSGDTNPSKGTLTADIILRAYRYSGGVYTQIVSIPLTAQSLTGTATTYTLPSTTASAMTFGASDFLYIDLWLNVTGNTNASTVQDVRLSNLSTDTVGQTGNPLMMMVTPGSTGSGTGTTTGIALAPNVLTFTGAQNSSNPPTQNVLLTDTGNTSGTWNTTVQYGSGATNWLIVTPANGSITPASPQSMSIDVNMPGILAGAYTATLTTTFVSSAGVSTTATASVTLTVTPAIVVPLAGTSLYNITLYKDQQVIVLDANGNFLDCARDVPLLSGFKESINGAISPLRVSLPRKFDDFDLYGAPGSHATIRQGNIWQFWLFGAGLPGTGLLRYQGVLDSFEPEIAENGQEKVVITLTPRSSALADHGIVGSPLQYGTVGQPSTYIDPVTMFTNFFSYLDLVTGVPYAYPLTIDAAHSATNSGNATQFTFQAQTLASAFSSILLMLPPNWFYRCNPDTSVTINVPPTTAQHVLRVGQHCGIPQYSQDYTQLKNVAYFKGYSTSTTSTVNGVTTTTNTNTISGTRVDTASLAQFGERLVTASDNRVTDTTTANLLAQGYINTLSRPQLRTKIRIPDYRGPSANVGYDIESLAVGDTIQMVDQSSTVTVSLWDQAKWDVGTWDASSGPALNQTAIIVSLDYQWDYVDCEIGNFQPSSDRSLFAVQQRLNDYAVI